MPLSVVGLCVAHRPKLLYEVVMAGNLQIDFLDAVRASSAGKETSLYTAAIPMAFGTHVRGTRFRMVCLWHADGKTGLQVGELIDLEMTKPVHYKRCFLLRHEIVKIVGEFTQMVSNITQAEVQLRGPRRDAWWKRFCVCRTRDLYGLLVQCTQCANWYHPECLRLDALPAPRTNWFCRQSHCRKYKRNLAPKLEGSAEPREPPRDREEGAVLRPIKMLHKVNPPRGGGRS
jgi:hypothetical protein